MNPQKLKMRKRSVSQTVTLWPGVRPSLRHCETSCSVAHGGSVCRVPLKQEIWTRIYVLNFQPLCLEFPKKVDQLISYCKILGFDAWTSRSNREERPSPSKTGKKWHFCCYTPFQNVSFLQGQALNLTLSQEVDSETTWNAQNKSSKSLPCAPLSSLPRAKQATHHHTSCIQLLHLGT